MPLLVISGGKTRKARFNDYFEAVKSIVSLVPIGYVTTYGSIARLLGISPRLVGALLKVNDEPLIVPCHRVVKSSGELGGYSLGGEIVKRKLLELEGVGFDSKGRVLKKHIIDVAALLA